MAEVEIERRGFLKLVAATLGGQALMRLEEENRFLTEGPPKIENINDFFSRMMRLADQVPDWQHPEARLINKPGFAPYLPATEEEVIARARKREIETGNQGIGWGEAVFPRVIVLPSEHPKDHIKDTYDAVKSLGEKRGWGGDITAWEGTWVYPMIIMGNLEDLQKNRQVKVMSNGRMVEIDPVRLDSCAVAVNVVNRGNPKMAVYMVPQNGEIHARLPQDTTKSELTMAFALNQHHINDKLNASGHDVPAIVVRGVATAPATILACYPTDEEGNYETRVVKTRLEPLTGNVTIHLPKSGYKGDYSPFIVVRMPVVATDPKGETEVIFVPGSDVLPSNPKWAPKHRITEEMLKAGRLL
jgi:hypothetical protein